MDIAWLAQEARTIHQSFTNYFYLLVGTLIMLYVFLEYFKLAIGGTPQFTMLIGRALIASLLLMATPEIMNALSSITDSISEELGDINKVKYVMSKLGDKIDTFSWSWVSVKESILLLISFLTFFILYIAIHVADSLFIYAWMILYVFSPILIALYVLPATSGATKGLFRSLIEVSAWKIVWSVLASLLWSFALVELDKPDTDISFLSVLILNFMLFFSVIATPKITSALMNGGISQVASSLGSAVFAATPLTSPKLLHAANNMMTSAAKKAVMGPTAFAINKTRERFSKHREAQKASSKAQAKQNS